MSQVRLYGLSRPSQSNRRGCLWMFKVSVERGAGRNTHPPDAKALESHTLCGSYARWTVCQHRRLSNGYCAAAVLLLTRGIPTRREAEAQPRITQTGKILSTNIKAQNNAPHAKAPSRKEPISTDYADFRRLGLTSKMPRNIFDRIYGIYRISIGVHTMKTKKII
jgi:hypothetical protein